MNRPLRCAEPACFEHITDSERPGKGSLASRRLPRVDAISGGVEYGPLARGKDALALPRSANEPVDTVPYLRSVIPEGRLRFMALQAEATLLRLGGNLLEVGVYRGGSLVRLAALVRKISPNSLVFAVDTFKGHPYSDGHPVHPTGKYSDVDLGVLKGHVRAAGLLEYVRFIEGRVEDVLNTSAATDISFAHVDCDLYAPISFCARVLPTRMIPSGVIYYDDYGHDHCPGATEAIQEAHPNFALRGIYFAEDHSRWSTMVEVP